MSIHVSRTASLLTEAMNYRAARQDMIASNIANADTPNYKPRDISFEQTLIAKKASLLKDNSKTLQMAETNPAHLKPKTEVASVAPTLFYRDGHMARNDGNSVDIDVETTEMSKNSIMFNALVAAKKKDGAIFTSVIEASKRLS